MAVSRLAGRNSAITRPKTPIVNEATAGHRVAGEVGGAAGKAVAAAQVEQEEEDTSTKPFSQQS